MRIAIHDYAGHPFIFELSRELARRGHEIRHFYFAGDPGPKGRLTRNQDDPPTFSIEPIEITQTYSKSNLVRRWFGDRSYGRVADERIRAFQPDVIISGNTPLDALVTIINGANKADIPFVFWMQDFYSLAAGLILKEKMPGVGHAMSLYYNQLESALLRASDSIVLISDDFIPDLEKFGVVGDMTVVPNWGALPSIPVGEKDNAWAKAHGLHDKFVFLYSGTMALKHNPDLLWRMAESFRDDPDVRVVVASAGVSVDALKARNAEALNPNLIFLPLQPIEVFPDMLASADALVALLETDAGRYSVPSKVLSYLCAARPILLSAPPTNLASRIVAQAGAGVCVESSDADAMIAAAHRLRTDRAFRAEAGAAGRAYAEATFDIPTITDRFEQIFHEAAKRRRQAA